MLSKNIAEQAVLAGYSVLFRTAAELLDDVQCDSPERRRQRIAAYTRPHLLCIDEIGYLSYDDHAADLLYKVINPRYEKRRSLLVSTNLAFKDWNGIFPNATCIVTLIDRLTHHADVTLIEGDSYRRRESEAEAAARRKPRAHEQLHETTFCATCSRFTAGCPIRQPAAPPPATVGSPPSSSTAASRSSSSKPPSCSPSPAAPAAIPKPLLCHPSAPSPIFSRSSKSSASYPPTPTTSATSATPLVGRPEGPDFYGSA